MKKKMGRFWRVTTTPCPFLKEDCTCDVYDSRNNIQVGDQNFCVSSMEAFDKGMLPRDCPYTKFYKGKKYKCVVFGYKKIGRNDKK